MQQARATRGFLVHLGVFVLVVGGLAALNLYCNPDNLWFVWGFSAGASALPPTASCFWQSATPRSDVLQQRGFLVHLFVFLTVNALLIVVNLLHRPDYYWFLFPLVGWGLLLAAHAYLTFYRRRDVHSSSAARTGAKS